MGRPSFTVDWKNIEYGPGHVDDGEVGCMLHHLARACSIDVNPHLDWFRRIFWRDVYAPTMRVPNTAAIWYMVMFQLRSIEEEEGVPEWLQRACGTTGRTACKHDYVSRAVGGLGLLGIIVTIRGIPLPACRAFDP